MAITYEVKVTRQALEQMKEITHYIAHELCAPDTAYNLLDEMENTINSLADMPERMSLADEEPWRTQGVRKALVKNFIIYFWVDDENVKVQVIAVIYEKRDQLEQLKRIQF